MAEIPVKKKKSSASGQLAFFAFFVFLATYLSLGLLEYLSPGFVSNFMNLRSLLWPTIGAGWLVVWQVPHLFEGAPVERSGLIKKWLIIAAIALFGGLALWVKVRSLGLLGIIETGAGVLFFVLVAFTAVVDSDESEGDWS